MTAPDVDRILSGVRRILERLAQDLRRLLEALEPVLETIQRRTRLAYLAGRYGVSVRPCPVVPGSLVVRSSRRLRPAVVEEVVRLTRREGGGERRRNGERQASA